MILISAKPARASPPCAAYHQKSIGDINLSEISPFLFIMPRVMLAGKIYAIVMISDNILLIFYCFYIILLVVLLSGLEKNRNCLLTC